MVVKKKGLYLGLLLSLLGIGNVIQAYGLIFRKKTLLYKFTVKNETGYQLKLFVDYYEDCKLYIKRLDSGTTIKIKSPCGVKQVSAFVYTRPDKVYGGRKISAMPYYNSSKLAGDMTFVIRRDGKEFRVTKEEVQ